jgi:hypothetical protein
VVVHRTSLVIKNLTARVGNLRRQRTLKSRFGASTLPIGRFVSAATFYLEALAAAHVTSAALRETNPVTSFLGSSLIVEVFGHEDFTPYADSTGI